MFHLVIEFVLHLKIITTYIYLLVNSQMVVGWPPIRAFRMNNLVNQSKDTTSDGDNALKKSNKKESTCGKDHDKQGSSLFVKVNMDGDPIGRKVDLNAHLSYDSLAHALELMFRKPTSGLHTSLRYQLCVYS